MVRSKCGLLKFIDKLQKIISKYKKLSLFYTYKKKILFHCQFLILINHLYFLKMIKYDIKI